MNRGEALGDRGGRIERCCRVGGVVLMVGAVLASALNDVIVAPRWSSWMALVYSNGVAARVLAPAGAMLVASSLAVRALIRPFSSPSTRSQLVAGVCLLDVGVFQMALGPSLLPAVTDFLGATANAGVLVVETIARTASMIALPLGVALLAVHPLVRLAETMQAQAVSGAPPDIESLD